MIPFFIGQALQIATVAAVFAIAGCGKPGAGTEIISDGANQGLTPVDGGNKSTAVITQRPSQAENWANRCPFPSDAPKEPLGKDTAELTRRYGNPVGTDTFILAEALDPVRRAVRNTLASPGDLQRRVKEMTWRSRGCELRVWLTERDGRWRAVHTMRSLQGGEH